MTAPHVIRLVREMDILHMRIESLSSMIARAKAGTLDFALSCPVELLERQLAAMQDYHACLVERWRIEGRRHG